MKRKMIIEIEMHNTRPEALISIIPTLDDNPLEKYYYTSFDKVNVMKEIEKKMIERAKAEPEIYKHFGI